MVIIIPDAILLRLETWCCTAGSREVSGLGAIEIRDGDIHVNSVHLLDVGSEGFTNIPPERIAALLGTGVSPTQLKLWWHRHPVGNGAPGPHNWSNIDESTIHDAPLGSSPSMVKWSVSMVRTPLGWVGRVDHYIKDKTSHLEVIQPFSVAEHERVWVLGTRGRQIPKQRAYHPVSKREKESIVNGVCKFLKIRSGHDGQKNWLYRKMADLGLDQKALDDMTELLHARVPPEEIAELYFITLYDMRALGLISWAEMEKAMSARYDQMYGQDQLWAD